MRPWILKEMRKYSRVKIDRSTHFEYSIDLSLSETLQIADLLSRTWMERREQDVAEDLAIMRQLQVMGHEREIPRSMLMETRDEKLRLAARSASRIYDSSKFAILNVDFVLDLKRRICEGEDAFALACRAMADPDSVVNDDEIGLLSSSRLKRRKLMTHFQEPWFHNWERTWKAALDEKKRSVNENESDPIDDPEWSMVDSSPQNTSFVEAFRQAGLQHNLDTLIQYGLYTGKMGTNVDSSARLLVEWDSIGAPEGYYFVARNKLKLSLAALIEPIKFKFLEISETLEWGRPKPCRS